MDLEILARVYTNGDQLILAEAHSAWVGIKTTKVIELFYAEKTEEGVLIHQSEYFSTFDIHTAKEAFFKRLGDGQPQSAVKACGLGYDLETVDKYEAVIQQWEKNLASTPFGRLSNNPVRVFTSQEINAQNHGTYINQTIILSNKEEHKGVATFCSDDYCFLLNALRNDKSFPKSVSCSFSLPVRVVPRPEFESGILNTIEEYNKVFHKDAVTLQSIFQVVKFLYENDYITTE